MSKQKHTESKVQISCVKWFRATYPELKMNLFSVPNGGARRELEAKILKAEGETKGVSDLILLVPAKGYHGICIEFKKDEIEWEWDIKKGEYVKVKEVKTYQKPEQKAFQKAVESQGYLYVVIRLKKEFEDLMTDYLGDPNKTNLERILNGTK